MRGGSSAEKSARYARLVLEISLARLAPMRASLRREEESVLIFYPAFPFSARYTPQGCTGLIPRRPYGAELGNAASFVALDFRGLCYTI
jgi:hypothetical protein